MIIRCLYHNSIRAPQFIPVCTVKLASIQPFEGFSLYPYSFSPWNAAMTLLLFWKHQSDYPGSLTCAQRVKIYIYFLAGQCLQNDICSSARNEHHKHLSFLLSIRWQHNTRAEGNHNIKLMILPGQFALSCTSLLHSILSLFLLHNRFSNNKKYLWFKIGRLWSSWYHYVCKFLTNWTQLSSIEVLQNNQLKKINKINSHLFWYFCYLLHISYTEAPTYWTLFLEFAFNTLGRITSFQHMQHNSANDSAKSQASVYMNTIQ